MLYGALVGAIVGAFIGLFVALSKIKKVKQRFGVEKGMTIEQVIAALGEPHMNTSKGNNKSVCVWNLTLDGKPFKVTVSFKDGIAKSVG